MDKPKEASIVAGFHKVILQEDQRMETNSSTKFIIHVHNPFCDFGKLNKGKVD